jgi:hypothetical protein
VEAQLIHTVKMIEASTKTVDDGPDVLHLERQLYSMPPLTSDSVSANDSADPTPERMPGDSGFVELSFISSSSSIRRSSWFFVAPNHQAEHCCLAQTRKFAVTSR